jgi:hypothetical protein
MRTSKLCRSLSTWGVVCLLPAILILPAILWGQNAGGTVEGVVQDASGARIPEARISIRQLQSSTGHEIVADSRGEFRLDNIPPGSYRVTVNAKGFAEASSDVAVQVSAVRDVTVSMQPEVVRQSVNVQGAASSITSQPLDTTTAVHGGVVTAQDLETIPLAARSFANISYLVPGTEPVEPSDPTKARITAVSFGGSSGLNDQLSVDGGDNSDDYIGGFLQNFSPDDVQEFAVRTSQEDADTGRMTSGSVVITTKRGGNDFHGDLAFYERAAALNARFPIENPPPNPKQPFERQNYIGTLGGPIKKDKLWFFSSIEAVHEKASIAYSPTSLTQLNALASLAAEGLIPGVTSISVPGSVPIPYRDYLGSERIDWSESQRSQWFVRGSIDNYTTNNSFVQQATLPSTGTTWGNKYENGVIGNQYTFSPAWIGTFTFDASALHMTETRNSDLGFALAFPISSTFQTISGFETFGDNQFVTPITAFPVVRNQEKYQFRYDVSHAMGSNAPRFGIDFIHEPVLSGALSGTKENLTVFPFDPTYYLADPAQFSEDLVCGPTANPGATCTHTPASNGSFSQDVQRLGLYAENSWRATPHFTINYGLRWDTTFGLFTASGRSQLEDPAYLTLRALDIPLIPGAPHDYRHAFAPRIGIAYGLNGGFKTVLRAGFGMFYNDLAQNGWVTALQQVNEPPGVCVNPGDPGCLAGAANGGNGAIIDPGYHTPYAIHSTGSIEHAFSPNWILNADYTHEQGDHSFARYIYEAGYTLFTPLFPKTDLTDQMNTVPNVTDFRSDNRSRYDGLSIHLQGNVSSRANLVVNYTLSKAKTWGCVLGELFDYVDGVCDPLHAFGPGDFGPSGEDVTDRLVIAGIFHAPAGFEISILSQTESARPITLTTPVDVNGLGDTLDDRAVINGVQTSVDEFRCTPYIQFDMRVARPVQINERWSVMPFIEFFNLFNRNNSGANYVTNIAALPNIDPTPQQLANLTQLCANPACTAFTPITSFKQVLVPAGALGDFFGPGTTVGIPFAAQIGVRANF